MTKKLLVLLLACVLCGSLVFAGCSNASQEQTDEASEAEVTEGAEAEVIETEETTAEVSQADIEDSIIGKWILTDRDGQPVTTNEKVVYTFESSDKALVSASLNSHEEAGAVWIDQLKADVAISGNKVTLTYSADDDTTSVHEYTINSITDKEFTAHHRGTVTKDGKELLSLEDDCRYVKVDADYSEDIIGTWEGQCLTEKFVYNDGKAHRWEFKDDGTYAYYTEEDNNWTRSSDTLNEYFVDGNLLCVRWVEDGTENREWWEITIDGDAINWTALCDDEEGKTFIAEYAMNRVENGDTDVAELIIGKWIVADRDGQQALSNDKTVFTFVSTTKAYRSASLTNRSGVSEVWVANQEFEVDMNGDKVTLTSLPDEHQTDVIEFTIYSINADEFTANHHVTVTIDGDEVVSRERPFRFVKVNDDYSGDIIGTWEGRCTSEDSVYDDGQDHRWEYKADGTYVYYIKDGDNWVPSDNTTNEYFVDGNLLCTRWIENGEEYREWWEITIDGDKMNWTALREDEESNTFTASFEMNKVK